MTERELLEAVRAVAALLGWLTYHTHDSRRSSAGFPDVVAVRGERLLVAELKVGAGRLSLQQTRWVDALRAVTTVEVYVWKDTDWRDGTIEAALR